MPGELPHYIHLLPEASMPDVHLHARRMVIVAEAGVSGAWQARVSDWIVAQGILYVMAWGVDCSTWDDAVDWALLAAFDYENVPAERFAMTTWHEDEPLEEVFRFARHVASHPVVELDGVVLLHIARHENREGLLAAYARV